MKSGSIRRLVTIVGVTASCLGLMAASAASSTTYYVGHGDDHDARVSFKVKGGEVRSALLDIRRMPVKRAGAKPIKVNVFGSVAHAPPVHGSDSAFRGVTKRENHQLGGTSSRFGFSGHLWAGRDPSGHTSLNVSSDYMWFNTGKIRWDASSVSKKRL